MTLLPARPPLGLSSPVRVVWCLSGLCLALACAAPKGPAVSPVQAVEEVARDIEDAGPYLPPDEPPADDEADDEAPPASPRSTTEQPTSAKTTPDAS